MNHINIIVNIIAFLAGYCIFSLCFNYNYIIPYLKCILPLCHSIEIKTNIDLKSYKDSFKKDLAPGIFVFSILFLMVLGFTIYSSTIFFAYLTGILFNLFITYTKANLNENNILLFLDNVSKFLSIDDYNKISAFIKDKYKVTTANDVFSKHNKDMELKYQEFAKKINSNSSGLIPVDVGKQFAKVYEDFIHYGKEKALKAYEDFSTIVVNQNPSSGIYYLAYLTGLLMPLGIATKEEIEKLSRDNTNKFISYKYGTIMLEKHLEKNSISTTSGSSTQAEINAKILAQLLIEKTTLIAGNLRQVMSILGKKEYENSTYNDSFVEYLIAFSCFFLKYILLVPNIEHSLFTSYVEYGIKVFYPPITFDSFTKEMIRNIDVFFKLTGHLLQCENTQNKLENLYLIISDDCTKLSNIEPSEESRKLVSGILISQVDTILTIYNLHFS